MVKLVDAHSKRPHIDDRKSEVGRLNSIFAYEVR